MSCCNDFIFILYSPLLNGLVNTTEGSFSPELTNDHVVTCGTVGGVGTND
jgi:hypothetical protein